jgi:cytosine/creatinine deaminase
MDRNVGTAMADTGTDDARFMRAAYEQALKSYHEGGLPIGAVMVQRGSIIAAGHNRRVQDGDPIAHGEMDCFRRAGRRPRYDDIVLYTTLSPCMMCAGTVVQFGVRRVVIGEARNFPGNPDFLRAHGVTVVLMDDAACVALMDRFKKERPELWDEDIAGRTDV